MNRDLKNENQDLGLISIGCMAVCFYWMFTYTGPFRILAEWELRRFGNYSEQWTFVGLFLVTLGAALGVRQYLKRRAAERPRDFPAGAAAMGITQTGRWWLPDYLHLGVALMPFVFGCSSLYASMAAGPLQVLGADDFANGRVQQSVVSAQVRGRLGAVAVEKDAFVYVALEGERTSSEAHVIVGVLKRDWNRLVRKETNGEISVQGTADLLIEGRVRQMFAMKGAPLAEKCWIVHPGVDPARNRILGVRLMEVSGAMVLVVFLISSWKGRGRRSRREMTTARVM